MEEDTFYESLMSENYDLVEFLLVNNCPYNSKKVWEAATKCSNRLLDYLYSKGFPIEEYIVKFAIKNGNLHALKWTLEKDSSFVPSKYIESSKN